jgi:UDP-arabinose 4-epimerase
MSDSQSQTILVVGGAGYIGSHVCKALAANGTKVVVLDNLSGGYREFAQWGPLEVVDLLDQNALDRVFRTHQPTAVLHFAAFLEVGESVREPGRYYRNNVVGSLNLLEAMRDHGVKHLVFSSTCAIYGTPEIIPIPEDHKQHPENTYGDTKRAVEQMSAAFETAHGIQTVCLRYFNAAGADPDGDLGEAHDPETHLIPLVLDAASGRRDSITVFGSDYDTSDGTCVRDYIHVTDLADAHLLALRHLQNGRGSDAFNLGNGRGYSVLEVIEAVQRVTGHQVPVTMGARRPGDPARLVGAAEKAKQVLGWNPKYAEIDTIISHAWNWHRQRSTQ